MTDEFEQLLAEMDAHLAAVKAKSAARTNAPSSRMDGRERPAPESYFDKVRRRATDLYRDPAGFTQKMATRYANDTGRFVGNVLARQKDAALAIPGQFAQDVSEGNFLPPVMMQNAAQAIMAPEGYGRTFEPLDERTSRLGSAIQKSPYAQMLPAFAAAEEVSEQTGLDIGGLAGAMAPYTNPYTAVAAGLSRVPNAGAAVGKAYSDPTPTHIVEAAMEAGLVPLAMAGGSGVGNALANTARKTGAGMLFGGTAAGTGMAVSMDVAEAAEAKKRRAKRQGPPSTWEQDPGNPAAGTLTVQQPPEEYPKLLKELFDRKPDIKLLYDDVEADRRFVAQKRHPSVDGQVRQKKADGLPAKEKLLKEMMDAELDRPFYDTNLGKAWPVIQMAGPAAAGALMHMGQAAVIRGYNAPLFRAVDRAEQGLRQGGTAPNALARLFGATPRNPNNVSSDIGVVDKYLSNAHPDTVLSHAKHAALPTIAGGALGAELRAYPDQYDAANLHGEAQEAAERRKREDLTLEKYGPGIAVGMLSGFGGAHLAGAGLRQAGLEKGIPRARMQALVDETGGANATAPERLMHVRQRMIDADRAAADVQTSAMQSERQRLINKAAYDRDVRVERMRPAATPTRDYRQPRATETLDNGPPMATPPPLQQWPEPPMGRAPSFARRLDPMPGPSRQGGGYGGGSQPPGGGGAGYGQGGGGGGGQSPRPPGGGNPSGGQPQGQAYGAKQQSTAYAALHDMLSSVPVSARAGYRLDHDEVARAVSDALRHKGLKTIPDLDARVAETIRRADQLNATGGSVFSEAGVRHLTNFSYGPSGGGRKTSLALPVAGGLGAYLMGQTGQPGEAQASPRNALRYDAGESKHHSYRQPRGGDGRFSVGPQ